ncbi:MAG: hypothetical protein K0S61_3980 [Anaerocolumna sp.]|jgi:hypothetical protein|nr:hypothetical protein [Anaerocolumna sp.]
MGLVELNNKVKYFLDNIDNVGVNCIFVDQNNARKNIYKAYNLNSDISLIKGTTIETLNNLKNRIEVCTLSDYDYEGVQDETIQHLNKADVIFSDDIISKISVNLDETNTLSETSRLDRLDFIVIQLVSEDEGIKDLYMFKKYIKSSTSFNKSVKIIFEGAQPKIFDKPILTISDNIDAILYDDEYYIISRNGFNSIFNYKEGFKRIVDSAYDQISTANVFTEVDLFIEDCKNHGLHLPRLAKAIASGCIENLKENSDNIKHVKDIYGLSIPISDDNKIIYRGKEDIPEILNMLLDHYVVSALSNRAMLAKAIEKYNMRE